MRILGQIAIISVILLVSYQLGLVLYASGLWDVEPIFGAIIFGGLAVLLIFDGKAFLDVFVKEEDDVADDDDERIDRRS